MFLSSHRFVPIVSRRIRAVATTQVFPFSSDSSSASSSTTSNDRISTEDIVKKVAETHDLSLAETRRILKTTFDTIVDVSLVTVELEVCPTKNLSISTRSYFQGCCG